MSLAVVMINIFLLFSFENKGVNQMKTRYPHIMKVVNTAIMCASIFKTSGLV